MAEAITMRGLRSTLVLLVITVSMGAYIYFVERHRAPSSAPELNEQLFDFEANDLSSLRVTSEDGGVTTLERTDEMWRIATVPTRSANCQGPCARTGHKARSGSI